MKIKGTVVLMKRNLLDFNDLGASLLDSVHELLGKKVSFQIISSYISNPGNDIKGKPTHLEEWLTTFTPLAASDSAFQVTFDWDKDNGIPGAFLIRNEHHSEFYLKTLTLEDVPGGEGGQGRVHFICNSWVYPAKYYKKDRVFFTNTTYLPHETPLHLRKYREQELVELQGDGKVEELLITI